MTSVAMFGAGRIGEVHARAIASISGISLKYVVDVDTHRADSIAQRYKATPADARDVLCDSSIDAVIIASPTNTHADLIEASAKAGKAIFCEKPVDIDRARVEKCLRVVEEAGVPFAIGFMRRFDPTYRALHARILAGDIGSIEQILIINRDLRPPPLEFVEASGGLVRDMTSHDVDLARWLLSEEPDTVFAVGKCLIEPGIGALGDVDSLQATLTTATGKLIQISESRRSAYGYDQRIEILGSKGMLQAGNKLESLVVHGGPNGLTYDRPLNFFLERYADAYIAQLRDFFEALEAGRPPSVGLEAARRAVALTEAALESMRTGAKICIP